MVRVDRQGNEEPLPGLPPNTYDAIRVSPDAGRLAFDAGRPRRIWSYDLPRGTATPVTQAGTESRAPLWTPDGTKVVFTRQGNDLLSLLRQNADGTGSTETIVTGNSQTTSLAADSWSRDGNTLFVTFAPTGGPTDIGAVDVRGDLQIKNLIPLADNQGGSAVSPDGQWLAYESNHSGTWEVYVERIPHLDNRLTLSIGGGMSPRWAADGRELFYQSLDSRGVVAVPLKLGTSATSAAQFIAGKAEVLFKAQYKVRQNPSQPNFEVLPDGRFLLLKPEPAGDSNASATVTIVQNWTEELKRIVPSPAGR